MGFVHSRQTDRRWMRGYFGVAALLFLCAFLTWLLAAEALVLRCHRPSDQCEVTEVKKLGGYVITFPLSTVTGAYVQRITNARGKTTGSCAVLNRKEHLPLEFCPLPDDEMVPSLDAYLKDPAEERYEAFVKSSANFFVGMAIFGGLIPFLLGMGLRRKLRLGTAHGYGSVHGEGHWAEIDKKRREREGGG